MGSPIRIHYKRISGVSDVPRPANPQLFFQVETKFFGRRFFHLRGFFVSAGRVRPVAQPCGHSSRNLGTGRSFRFSGKPCDRRPLFCVGFWCIPSKYGKSVRSQIKMSTQAKCCSIGRQFVPGGPWNSEPFTTVAVNTQEAATL